MGPCREAGQILPDSLRFVKRVPNGRLDGQALHLLGGVFGPEQAAFAPEELHGLEEPRADGASRNGEAKGMYEVARTRLLLCGEAAYRFLYRLFRPLRERCETFDEFGEVLANELLAELLLELGFVVVERAAVEVAYGVGDLGGQGDAFFEEGHDLLEARHILLQFLLSH